MATKIFDLELTALPAQLPLEPPYTGALVLLRYQHRPVGKLWFTAANGHISRANITQAVSTQTDWPFWQAVLHSRLDWTGAPPQTNPLPLAPIAVCTRNRTQDLARCLPALLALPNHGQEILVIDNCPADDSTARLVAGYGDRVRYVREDRPGLNVARNRAMREARHPIVAFNDDDALPDPGWLRALLSNFADPLAMAVTGLTMPLELETPAQEWFERHSPFERGFNRAAYDFTTLPALAAARAGAGANMALRRSIIEQVGPFDETLDAGTPTHSGGDTEMLGRILAAGGRIIYEPAALNWHRHRRAWPALRQVIYGYGVGVYATWTRQLLIDRELAVFYWAWAWFWYQQLPALLRRLACRPGSVPFDLQAAEWRGCLAGPWAYFASQRNYRKQLKQYDTQQSASQPDYSHP